MIGKKLLLDSFLAVVCFCALGTYLFYFLPAGFGDIDLVQYWSAARVFLAHGNPYDSTELLPLQQSVLSLPNVIRMWNPPLVFPLIAWLAFFPFRIAVVLWLIFSCCAFAVSYHFLNRIVGATRSHRTTLMSRKYEFLFIISFYPVFNSLSWGQLSCFLLLGLALFLYFAGDDSFRGQLLAGFSLTITLMKPHLLFLGYLFLLFYTVHTKRWVLLGSFIGFALLTALVVADIQPDIWSYYLSAIQSPPIYFKTPTIGSFLQTGLEAASARIRFLPSITGALLLLLTFLIKPSLSKDLRFLLCLIPATLLLSPYGWGYDQTLLLPTAVWILRASSEKTGRISAAPVILIALNVLSLLLPSSAGQQYLIWYPLVVLLLAIKSYRDSDYPIYGRNEGQAPSSP